MLLLDSGRSRLTSEWPTIIGGLIQRRNLAIIHKWTYRELRNHHHGVEMPSERQDRSRCEISYFRGYNSVSICLSGCSGRCNL